jgi:hypothetical protein
MYIYLPPEGLGVLNPAPRIDRPIKLSTPDDDDNDGGDEDDDDDDDDNIFKSK